MSGRPTKWVLCFVICTTLLCRSYTEGKNQSSVAKGALFLIEPGKYLPDSVLETEERQNGITAIECGAKCQSNLQCMSFNLRARSSVCELSSTVDFSPNKSSLIDDAASQHYTKVPRDCADYNGVNGVHNIYVKSMGKQLRVSCEAGWTVLMRRTGPDLNFNRSWTDYRIGFGDVTGDYWLGLEAFHHLTYQGNYSLMVEVRSLPTDNYYWEIHHGFRIGPESEKYVFSEFSQGDGTLIQDPEYWPSHFGMPFTTFDNDNDDENDRDCAELFQGGWWYRECTLIALTARMATTGNCTQFCFAHFKHFGVPKGERGVKTHLLNWAVMKIKKIE